MSADYDLLIVGAGPAGLAAALAAAPSGARIALVDDNPAAGGQIWRDGPRANLPPRAHQMRQRLAGQANVEHFPATRVVACGPGRRLLLEDPQRGWQVGYRRLVLCTGARELLLPFPGWTLPGVTGAGGLQALAKGGLPLAGQRLVVAGSGPLLLASAASASQCGARLLRVAEQAPARTLAAFAVRLPRWPGKLWQAAGLFARS
ncbi:NAD(P)/FAD-dependent oxidoreductase, partial [Pseudomonas aeruginosa]|nr:NAD(P)/FAD-dependent oxidoreductase [Pseudomonas aeruginosa]